MFYFKGLFDRLLKTAIPIFGETVIYRPKVGGVFRINGVFDEKFEQVDPNTEEVIASNVPMLGIRLGDIPFSPKQGDKVNVDNRDFEVTDCQEDGQGGARLILLRK